MSAVTGLKVFSFCVGAAGFWLLWGDWHIAIGVGLVVWSHAMDERLRGAS